MWTCDRVADCAFGPTEQQTNAWTFCFYFTISAVPKPKLVWEHSEGSLKWPHIPTKVKHYLCQPHTHSHTVLLIVSLTRCLTQSLGRFIQRSQRNLWEAFLSAVILQPCCFSRLGTIPGMSPPAVSDSSTSCSSKCQLAEIGFNAVRAHVHLVSMSAYSVCEHVLMFVWMLTAWVLICSHCGWSPKSRLHHVSVHWEGHCRRTDVSSQSPVWEGRGESQRSRKIRVKGCESSFCLCWLRQTDTLVRCRCMATLRTDLITSMATRLCNRPPPSSVSPSGSVCLQQNYTPLRQHETLIPIT